MIDPVFVEVASAHPASTAEHRLEIRPYPGEFGRRNPISAGRCARFCNAILAESRIPGPDYPKILRISAGGQTGRGFAIRDSIDVTACQGKELRVSGTPPCTLPCTDNLQADLQLAIVAQAWASLPANVRDGILMIIRAIQ